MSTTTTVYIVNANTHDFSTAEEYGELKAVTVGMQPVFKLEKLKDRLVAGLQDFQADDYLLISGPTILSILATTMLLAKFNCINILMHDATTSKYVHKILEL